MKCPICGKENVIKLYEEKKGKYTIETYCCKDCYHVDSYCFDFKKRDLIMEKAQHILATIKEYRINGIKNKKDAINMYEEAINNILKIFNSLHINNELTVKYNEILTNINEAKNSIEEYLKVENMLTKENEQGYTNDGKPLLRDVYYIEDFPVNYEDCASGKTGLFFYLSKAKYRDLNAVKNHTSETTVLDILDEYYKKEALTHSFINLNNDLKNEDWYIKTSNFRELKEFVNKINEAIELYNK